MKLLFKERLMTWLDKYDIYNEQGEKIYYAKTHVSLGHYLSVYDAHDESEIGSLKERIMSIVPKYDITIHGSYTGCISKKVSSLTPKYNIDYKGWRLEGDMAGWNFRIYDKDRNLIAHASKQLMHFEDRYIIDVPNDDDVLDALMVILTVEAERLLGGN